MSCNEESDTSGNKRQVALRLTGFAALGVAVLFSACGFIVRENESAIVLRFGQPREIITEAGWRARLPWPMETVERLDSRLQYAEIRISETLTRDKRNVIMPMYYAWRVNDPLAFFQSVSTAENANEKLNAIITSARNSILGQHRFDELVTLREAASALAEIEEQILEIAQQDARDALGIDLQSIGILQLNLPEANTDSVFRRMRAERKQEASRYRAEGRSQAEQIRAETDKQSSILIAEAKRYAEETRGRAEAEAARIYADAHGQDADFYLFLRRLQSLRSVVDKNTTLILDTAAPPFDLLRSARPVRPADMAGESTGTGERRLSQKSDTPEAAARALVGMDNNENDFAQ